MRKNKLLSDIILVVLSLTIYVVLRIIFGKSWLYFVAVPGLAIFAHTFLMKYFDKKFARQQAAEEYILRQKFESPENKLNTAMAQLQSFCEENDQYKETFILFNRYYYTFSSKEKALKALIEMNGDKARSFLEQRSEATRAFLAANAKKLLKSLIVYNAQSERNRPKTVQDVPSVQKVFKSLKELVDAYDLLLEEVERMGDDFNLEDPKLKEAVENLQQLRVAQGVEDEDEDEEEDDGEITLTLNPSSKSKFSDKKAVSQQGGGFR